MNIFLTQLLKRRLQRSVAPRMVRSISVMLLISAIGGVPLSTSARSTVMSGEENAGTANLPPLLDAQRTLPSVKLTSQIMFLVLAAELALQRGQPAPAYQTYLELTRTTRDPRMAQRAAEIALGAQSPADALAAARLWRQYEPNSSRAAQFEAALLVLSGKLNEAQPILAAELAKIPVEDKGEAILALQLLIARGPAQASGLNLLQTLLKNELTRPEAHLALARQQLLLNDSAKAWASLRQALALKPDYEAAALLLAQLGPTQRQQAIELMRDFAQKNPKSRNAHIALAQLYLADQQFDAARREFQLMRAQNSADPAPIMALALIYIQQKRYDDAQHYLQQYVHVLQKRKTQPELDVGQAYFYLAQIATEKKNDALAMQWLSKINPASAQYMPAWFARVQLLAKAGKVNEARKLLADLPSQEPRLQILAARTDGALLAEAQRYVEAEATLARVYKAYPNEPDVLYDYAMLAEKNRHYTLMENLLRRLMMLQPDNPNAYNALGYSLADRSQRLNEADKLIEKASSLAPDDAFIMDSLGWVKYRLGNPQQAIQLLRRAYQLQPNAEIGAHLGEVLWAQGLQTEAKQIWKAAAKLEADNDILQQTLKRFSIEPSKDLKESKQIGDSK
ncbi:MAG: Tetratricopeptide repeat-containing protein [Glomeribacter sp. 1016415]|nr:Tetratricopeptide repeat-containing protein [Glomeribacter sp. 1016415]